MGVVRMKKAVLIAAVLWLGMQIMAGYIAASVLFKMLPKMVAGEIAGILFSFLSFSGMFIWAGLYLFLRRKGQNGGALLPRCTVVLWGLLAFNQFVITPVIEAYKNQTENWLLQLAGGSFGMWHGISSIVFMASALLAFFVVWRLSDFEF